MPESFVLVRLCACSLDGVYRVCVWCHVVGMYVVCVCAVWGVCVLGVCVACVYCIRLGGMCGVC